MDYWDFLQSYMRNGFNPASIVGGLFNDMYNKAYDESHGSTRYWLSKVPWYSWLRRETDNAKKAQDIYDNTGRDPAYIDRISGGGSVGLSSSAGRIARMARSLSSVYGFEIVEDVSGKFNNSYW